MIRTLKLFALAAAASAVTLPSVGLAQAAAAPPAHYSAKDTLVGTLLVGTPRRHRTLRAPRMNA